ncbi:helix-turn-helix transcriptional regulator [Petroclostridium sp. X23]|uniref:helix-turn-helix domain-containing protein n=1 Tax=Petroclostridium sp. X23 TaxID=3045146 RepID=UPI0024ACEBCB|nr:helix-turn-helix transcriptional regulator [Petroclostridium sp. X23]WHH60404.1 helix-turn-helix transcriptional regulator [Petroclostridium sp. X23]
MIKIKISNLLGTHKMSQKDLADKTGIRAATISTYYHETVKHIAVEHLDKLCKAFDCSISDLLEYIPDKK